MAQPIVIGVCPACAGQGQSPINPEDLTQGFAECLSCGGSGDLYGFQLREAYKRGYRDAALGTLRALREMESMMGTTRQSLAKPHSVPTVAELKTIVGGG